MTVPVSVDLAFRERAAAAGLLDVAWELADSPLGPLLVAATERGVCRISFDPEPDRGDGVVVNRVAGQCERCGARVEVGAGQIVRMGARDVLACRSACSAQSGT